MALSPEPRRPAEKEEQARLIIDLDSTEDPAHGKQEGVSYNGHFAKNCFHPLFAFTSDGDCLGAKLRPGNVHSADGALEFIKPIVERYRGWFKLFWFRGDAAFANPETYEYCQEHRITYFIRLPSNAILMRLLELHLNRPVGRPPKSGIQFRIVNLHYQASCQRFEVNQARLKMGVLAYNLLHMIRQFYVWGEEVRRSIDWLIKRLIKVGARISYHARRWYVHVASAFPLTHHYRVVLAWGY